VLPQLAGTRKALDLLGRVDVWWLVAGVALEIGALLAYSQLTRSLLPREDRLSLATTGRITLSTLAVSHVVPGGTIAGASLGFRLLTAAGVTGTDAGFALATQGLGSAVVLNVLLWIGLVVTIPLRGFDPIYGTAAIVGALALAGVGAAVLLLTRGEDRAARVVCRVARRVPFVDENGLSNVLHRVSERLSGLLADRPLLARAATWAALNWLLDAASLWCFVAAFGRFVNPVELFAAYGIANVAGALPVTPGGLGVVDSIAPLLLVSFGVTRSVATLGVLGWRLVNFWLPIPVGAIAYVSLKVPRGAGLKAMRAAVSTLLARPALAEEPPPEKPLPENPQPENPQPENSQPENSQPDDSASDR